MQARKLVTCGQCPHFIPPLPIYEPGSIGQCKVFEDWLNKFPRRRPPPKEYDKNYAAIGSYPATRDKERYCMKFKQRG